MNIARMLWVEKILRRAEEANDFTALTLHSKKYAEGYVADIETGPHLMQLAGDTPETALTNIGLIIGVDIGQVDETEISRKMAEPMMTENDLILWLMNDPLTCLTYMDRVARSEKPHTHKKRPIVEMALRLEGASVEDTDGSQ